MHVLQTSRLTLRYFCPDDAKFVVKLLNEPSFIEYIGDKGVRTVEEAKEYLLNGPIDSYERFGYGLNRVELNETGEPIGMCGLVRRDYLDDADRSPASQPKCHSGSNGQWSTVSGPTMPPGRGTVRRVPWRS